MTTLTRATSKQQFWHEHILQWRDSGFSQASYCRKHGLNQNSLSFHKLKQSKQLKTVATKTSGFISLPLPQVMTIEEPITLHFTNGLKLSGIAHSNIALVKLLTQALA
jgi:hypothetical protein